MAKNTLLPVQTLLQSKGRLLDISTPVVMGILNATPDSFYNKGRNSSEDGLLKAAEKMLHEGAAILDLGGSSTKPGAAISNMDEELKRTIPIVAALCKRFPDVWLSIDTYHSQVAAEAVAAGASIVNDISAGRFDEAMMATVAEWKVPYIAMHIQGTPQTMQQNPWYDDVVFEVRDCLRTVCDAANATGITDIIIDPGFGFGKTVAHNFQLLNGLPTFRILGKPILAGLSRKSMICKTLGITPEYALNGTTALNMTALQNGANILRVHDVREAVEVVRLWAAINSDAAI